MNSDEQAAFALLQRQLTQAQQALQQQTQELARIKRENAKLRLLNNRAEEKLFAALDGNRLCLWEQHIPSGNLTIFNMRWGELLGFTREELAAHVDSWKQNLHPDDKEWVIKAFEDHVKGESDYYQAVHRMLHKDGSITWVSDRGRIVERKADGTPLRMMGTHIDITQEKRYEAELSRLAHCDPLTNLSNRKAIIQAYESYQSEHDNGGALLFIDLDGFKGLNDKLGHKFGDLLLLHVAKELKANAGKSAHCGRFGGDEFIILFPSQDRQRLEQLATRLLAPFDHSFELDGDRIKLGLSIGIYCFSAKDSFGHSCELADSAMYRVKNAGKHGYEFYAVPLLSAAETKQAQQ